MASASNGVKREPTPADETMNADDAQEALQTKTHELTDEQVNGFCSGSTELNLSPTTSGTTC